MKTWSNRKRVVFLAAICVVAAIATAIAVAAIDDYARSEVRTRAKAVYFEELRKTVAEEVSEKLQKTGCDVRAGVKAGDRFLTGEREHMSLWITHEPDWGWQVVAIGSRFDGDRRGLRNSRSTTKRTKRLTT